MYIIFRYDLISTAFIWETNFISLYSLKNFSILQYSRPSSEVYTGYAGCACLRPPSLPLLLCPANCTPPPPPGHLLVSHTPLIHHFPLPLLSRSALSSLPRPSPLPYGGQGEGSIAWAHHRASCWRTSHVSVFPPISVFYITWQHILHGRWPHFHLH